MISPQFETTLHNVFVAARARRQVNVTVEDLLLSLSNDPDARPVLLACGANLDQMRRSLRSAIVNDVPRAGGADDIDVVPTLAFQRVIQRTILHVQSSGSEHVTGASCLVAIFGEKDSKAVHVLFRQGVTRLDVVNFIVHGVKKVQLSENAEQMISDLAANSQVTATSIQNSEHVITNEVKIDGLRLFVSYSHSDVSCLKRMLVHLRPLERQGLIDCWADNKIRAGDKWKDQLADNLERAAVAILLVSADFLASDFIVNNELPPLLLGAEARGLRILPVIIKPCGFHRDRVLQSFQSINDPTSPLLGMTEIGQETIYDKVAEEVYREIESRRKLR